MDERTIFTEALGRDASERAAYLDVACAGDPALRARVEALLRSHEGAGSFLGKPVPERLGEALPARGSADDTRTGRPPPDDADALDFLEPSDKPGSVGRLGHYEVREVVGRGGMGVVLKAFDEQLQRVVAIKVMSPQPATGATARRRFTREARAAAAVIHDNVVTIHAVADAGPLPFIVMQYVAGASLQDRIDRTGPLPLAEILRIGVQTAAGLAAAHAQGLVHRDVKPANILLENGVERVKLTDFGLARAADDASLTQSGTVAGTPQYMSPEQAEGKAVDHRSDLFSLGSVLYAMCTGRPPFRAGTTVGVLKRVCEDVPTPVRESNPEAPDWMAAVIEKLHAKDPAARFQAAPEVAELLGQLLAHVQHPSAAPPPAVAKLTGGPPVPGRPARRKRWAVAAAVLVALFAALGAAEATGVTTLRATVTRLFTPNGVLVVETDDPGVKVTVEGDGGLVITGAGSEEIRLKPGSYRVRATREGQPVKLDRDLVAISRGDTQIVRVRLEGGAPAAAAPAAERGAFVLLGGTGVAERKFETLAEAVRAASDGDTIEVRGDGPFAAEPLSIPVALVIRAGAGYRPVIDFGTGPVDPGTALIGTRSPLVLEGLEFRSRAAPRPQHGPVVTSRGAPLHVANCRFLTPRVSCVHAWVSPLVSARNCEFLSLAAAVRGEHGDGGQWAVENCVAIGDLGLAFVFWKPPAGDQRIRLTRNTLVTGYGVWFQVGRELDPAKEGGDARPIRVDASENVFDTSSVVLNLELSYERRPPLEAPEAVAIAHRVLDWHDQRTLYAVGGSSVQWSLRAVAQPVEGPKSLAEWKQFWGTGGAELSEGRVRYQGGDLLGRLRAAPDRLTPDDFRLRPDSAGYRAGRDGRDLGADVDLVGPGAAYERWKKTPEYRQWVTETGQAK